MRWLSIFILVALLHDIVVPYPIAPSMKYDGCASIVTLDVCHASAPGFTDDDEVPGMVQGGGVMTPVLFVNYTVLISPMFGQLLLTKQNERPPTA